jgi:hypothetical protein
MDASPLVAVLNTTTLAHRCRRRGVHPIGVGSEDRSARQLVELSEKGGVKLWVDVEKQGANVLHTFPVTTSARATEEEPFKQKALEAAANAKLVPNEELESLNAKMHVSRGGQLTPYGDPHGVLAETKAGLDQVVRERAYLLWEQAGRPDGRPTTFGTKRSISASANALTRCGSGRVARKARRTSTGFGPAPLRRADASSVRKSGLLYRRENPLRLERNNSALVALWCQARLLSTRRARQSAPRESAHSGAL